MRIDYRYSPPLQMFLLDDLLLLPVKGLVGIFKEIHKYAEREMGDRDRLRERLLEAQVLFEMDEIGEEEYLRREKEIMEQLNALEVEGDESFAPTIPFGAEKERKIG